MKKQEKIKVIERHLSNGNITNALDGLSQILVETGDLNFQDQIILLKARWAIAEKGYKISGTSSKEEYNAAFNSTINGIQLLLKEYNTLEPKEKSNKVFLGIAFIILIFSAMLVLRFVKTSKEEQSPSIKEGKNKPLNADSQKTTIEILKTPLPLEKQDITKMPKIKPVYFSINTNLKDIEDISLLNTKFKDFFIDSYILNPKMTGITVDYELNVTISTDLIKNSKLFNLNLKTYKVQILIKSLYMPKQSICGEKSFEVLVEASNNESESIIQKNGLSKMLKTMNLNIKNLLCQ